jgi:hypothetical protein
MLHAEVFTITTSGRAVLLKIAEPEFAVQSPVKFDAAFLDRRMQAHREFQEHLAFELEEAIIREVRGLEGQ